LDAGTSVSPHRHDFAEWLWVESGRLRHQQIGSGERELTRGDACFLAPGAGHCLTGLDGAVMVTASMSASAWRRLRQRHGSLASWPWAEPVVHLDDRQLGWMSGAVSDLPSIRQDACDADWFVSGMLRTLRQSDRPVGAPPWLASAIARLSDPQRLVIGLPALIGLSGRSSAHVSRAVREHYGCTASELVLRLRLDLAARELRLSNRPILELSQACGFASLAHFYRSFAARFKSTPAAFRHAAVDITPD